MAVGEAQQVGQVGTAAAKLLDLHRGARAGDVVFAQVGLQFGPVEPLLLAHLAVFGGEVVDCPGLRRCLRMLFRHILPTAPEPLRYDLRDR